MNLIKMEPQKESLHLTTAVLNLLAGKTQPHGSQSGGAATSTGPCSVPGALQHSQPPSGTTPPLLGCLPQKPPFSESEIK